MRVDRFAIGFGPALVRRKWGETMFQVGVVPLGGYVQIAGLNPEDEAIEASDPRAYPNRPAWQRFLTIAAGPVVNYFFAVLLLLALNWILGIPDPSKSRVVAMHIQPGRPAAAAGMQDGDQILSIDGQAVSDRAQVQPLIGHAQGNPVTLEILRKIDHLQLRITPIKDDGVWRVGIELDNAEMRQQLGFMPALRQALHDPLTLTWLNLKAFGEMFRGKRSADFKSPIYIVRIMKEQLGRGLAEGLKFVAIISTLLGFFNLLPLPALDGGRLVFLGWELVTRRPVNQRVEQIVHLIGMILLLGLLLLLVVKDLRDWIFGA
jgi:regulator of sigma E protease